MYARTRSSASNSVCGGYRSARINSSISRPARSPRFSNSHARCVPINPEPPVISIFKKNSLALYKSILSCCHTCCRIMTLRLARRIVRGRGFNGLGMKLFRREAGSNPRIKPTKLPRALATGGPFRRFHHKSRLVPQCLAAPCVRPEQRRLAGVRFNLPVYLRRRKRRLLWHRIQLVEHALQIVELLSGFSQLAR